MTRIALGVLCGLFAVEGTAARAEGPVPRAYTLKAQGAFVDRARTITVVRDGDRERVDVAISPNISMATLYDFAAGRVFWIGWSGAGSCSSGRYLSARAPVEEDPVTGTPEHLAKLAAGRSRKEAGAGTVGGLPARSELLVGGRRPGGPDAEPWPTRVWLADQGGFLLKIEGEGAGGKATTLLEVTSLSFGKPQGTALEPPAGCIATDSEMDDTGQIRSRATAAVAAQVEATAGAAPGATPKGALAKIGGLVLEVVPQPDDGPCGTKLRVTGTVAVDGPATIAVGFRPTVGGLRFEGGENDKVILDAAGEVTVTREATLTRSLKGAVKLQAMVQGVNGHNGPLKLSAPVPFDVTCAGR